MQFFRYSPVVTKGLSPTNDPYQISPCNVNALKQRLVKRIKDMITQHIVITS